MIKKAISILLFPSVLSLASLYHSNLALSRPQEWWWEWAQDYFQLVEHNGQGWAAEVIEAAAGMYTNARVAGETLATNNEVISALSSLQSKISNLHMPAIPVTKTPSS
ncbi:hypothetical protein N7530_011251 [Penicillium desertorum]|uniref:Uncharacterized protein n=1 Tax=Penicillium desertorum TaxID=1303715 RepID=A0A9X0BHD8_9EURO|nr:hypothetical protein N7530_011251 [Penicillium desertorum]